MKKLTIEVSDELYALLEGMCETDCETPESVAAALVFEKIFDQDIDQLWEALEIVGEAFEETSDVYKATQRIADILAYASYSKDLPYHEGIEYLSKLVEGLNAIKENRQDPGFIFAMVEELEKRLGSQVPNQDELQIYQEEMECEEGCGCGHHH